MLNENKERWLLFVVLFLMKFTLLAQTEDSIFTKVDYLPVFGNCELGDNECSINNIVDYISENLKYPSKAKQEQIEGTVYLSFVVNKLGKVSQVKALNEIGGGCEEESISLINNMENWIPGEINGTTVSVELKLPIEFELLESTDSLRNNYILEWGNLNDIVTKKELLANFSHKIVVKNEKGKILPVSELYFAFQKGKYFKDAYNFSGKLNNKMKRVCKKVLPNGVLTIHIQVLDGTSVEQVFREFKIVK